MLFGLFRDRRYRHDFRPTQKPRDPIRRLRADRHPVADAVFDQLDPFRIVLGQHRVVDPDALDIAAVARHARIGDDNAVVRALFRTAAGQSDFQRHMVSSPRFAIRQKIPVVWKFNYRYIRGIRPWMPCRIRPFSPILLMRFIILRIV